MEHTLHQVSNKKSSLHTPVSRFLIEARYYCCCMRFLESQNQFYSSVVGLVDNEDPASFLTNKNTKTTKAEVAPTTPPQPRTMSLPWLAPAYSRPSRPSRPSTLPSSTLSRLPALNPITLSTSATARFSVCHCSTVNDMPFFVGKTFPSSAL